MTPGSSSSPTSTSVTSGTEQQGITVSVAVESQPATFGTRTVYTHIPSVRSSVPTLSSQESPPKRRKVEKTTAVVAPVNTVKAMQQYGYQEVLAVNQMLINRLTASILKNFPKQTEPKKQPPTSPKPEIVAQETRELLRQRVLTNTEKMPQSSEKTSRETSDHPDQLLPQKPQKQTIHASAKFAYGAGDREARRELQTICENTSYQVAKFCGVHIAPDRFYQLFEVTPARLLGFIKDKTLKKGNQFISPDVLHKMTPQKVQYLRDLAHHVYQFALKYRESRNHLVGHMLDVVHEMHAPPKNSVGSLYDVLSYYAKELKVRGLECSTELLSEFLRQNADHPRMRQWLAKRTFKRSITEKEYTELLDLLEMADSHCRHFRFYKAEAAKAREQNSTPDLPVQTHPELSTPIAPSLDENVTQSLEPVVSTSAESVEGITAQQPLDDEPQVLAEQAESEDASSLAPGPDTAPAVPRQNVAGLAPVYLTDIPLSREYPGITNSGNYCYMISAVQFLRATIPGKQQIAMIVQWRQRQEKNPEGLPETVTDAFSALLSVMSESREKVFSKPEYSRHRRKIEETFKHFAVRCIQHDSICTEARGVLRHRKGATYIHSLEQNDAQGFLMKLQQELGLDQYGALDLYEQLSLDLGGRHFAKPQTHPDTKTVLMLPLMNGDIQKDLDAFLESELVCRWTSEELAGAENLPKQGVDGYRSRQVIEIKADPSQLTGFTLCLKNTEMKKIRGQFKDQKMIGACEESISKVFEDISLPVTDPEIGNKYRLVARPQFIICHNGQNYQSGHNISLWLQDMGWILNDDDRTARVLSEPEDFLRKNNAYPYLVEYRVVSSEPV